MAGAVIQQQPMNRERTIGGNNESRFIFFDEISDKLYNIIVEVHNKINYADILLFLVVHKVTDMPLKRKYVLGVGLFPHGMGIISSGGEAK